MKKKGFTLIELLAVILILAIIAVIVTPIISKIIDEAKTQADKRSAEKFIRAAQVYYTEAQMDEAKNNKLGTNIIEELDLENVDATGTVIANTDGTTEMAIVIGKRCFTKTATQELKDIQISKDIENCVANSSGIAITNINSGIDSIVITLEESNSITLVSCKYGVERGSYTTDGTISGNTCTLSPVENGKRYYYELKFSDDSTKTGSIQAGVGNVTPGNGGSGGTIGGGSGSGSGSGGGTGVAAPILTESNGQTVYDGRMLANAEPIYFNVSTGEKCTNAAWTANGGANVAFMKTGCLRFWAYMEDDLSYTMILDRNTRRSSAWASSGNNSLGPVTLIEALKTDTTNWKGTVVPKNYTNVYMPNAATEASYEIDYQTDQIPARLITTNEIARITQNEGFSALTASSGYWFYLDGYAATLSGANWQTQIATSSQASAFSWLYNYLSDGGSGCLSYGCLVSGGGVSETAPGYWTSDAIAGGTSQAWLIVYTGMMRSGYNSSTYGANVSDPYYVFGVRPVITVLKSTLD